jgi:Ca2+-binding EF-hand superfamily protein
MQPLQLGKGDAELVFGVLDEDGCGVVYASEVQAVVERVGCAAELPPGELGALFDALGAGDADGDGMLDLDEFQAWWGANQEARSALFGLFPAHIRRCAEQKRAVSLERYLDSLCAKFGSTATSEAMSLDAVRKGFRKFTPAGRARIEADDFRALCRELDPGMSDEDVIDALEVVGTPDVDGAVAFEELEAWWGTEYAMELRGRRAERGGGEQMDELDFVERSEASQQRQRAAYMRRAFEKVDSDGSGEIDRSEFRTLCRRIDARLAEGAIAAAWAQIDADGSGAVDYAEFAAWWSSEHGRQLRGGGVEPAAAAAPEWTYKQLVQAVERRKAERAAQLRRLQAARRERLAPARAERERRRAEAARLSGYESEFVSEAPIGPQMLHFSQRAAMPEPEPEPEQAGAHDPQSAHVTRLARARVERPYTADSRTAIEAAAAGNAGLIYVLDGETAADRGGLLRDETVSEVELSQRTGKADAEPQLTTAGQVSWVALQIGASRPSDGDDCVEAPLVPKVSTASLLAASRSASTTLQNSAGLQHNKLAIVAGESVLSPDVLVDDSAASSAAATYTVAREATQLRVQREPEVLAEILVRSGAGRCRSPVAKPRIKPKMSAAHQQEQRLQFIPVVQVVRCASSARP